MMTRSSPRDSVIKSVWNVTPVLRLPSQEFSRWEYIAEVEDHWPSLHFHLHPICSNLRADPQCVLLPSSPTTTQVSVQTHPTLPLCSLLQEGPLSKKQSIVCALCTNRTNDPELETLPDDKSTSTNRLLFDSKILQFIYSSSSIYAYKIADAQRKN
jgi:hypothetical protein